jgi:nitric oxide reductase NorQ protein
MIMAGLPPVEACQVALINPMTDDLELAAALLEIVRAHFE